LPFRTSRPLGSSAHAANAGVVVGFTATAATFGSIVGNFRLTLASMYGGQFFAADGGTAGSARAVVLAGLAGGNIYFNIHNRTFPAREIRGQPALVPEPASLAIVMTSLGLIAATTRSHCPAVRPAATG